MFKSNGVLTKDPTYRLFTPYDWNGIPQPGITQAYRWGSYDAIYRSQLWVNVLVNKVAHATARLPLKVYRRGSKGRTEPRRHPYAVLLRRPNLTIDPYSFWLWVVSTLNIYGTAYLAKRRGPGARPIELVPIHPTKMFVDTSDGEPTYEYRDGERRVRIDRRDLIIFQFYGGVSPLEPLRSTLENEAGALAANSALWRNGARPSMVLKHPKVLTPEAAKRVADQWSRIQGGAENFAKTAILEEGMEAQVFSFNAEELQYIDSRRLNREECCAAYDVPPPVVHILDRATFSNITEQMRSMYRDTMAPKLKLIESTLELELRDGSFGGRFGPDFGEEVYAEFLMDEVLRGAFEVRAESYQAAINAAWLTPAEVRELENLPFVEGSDRLFINSAAVPIEEAGQPPPPEVPVEPEPDEPEPASEAVEAPDARSARLLALADDPIGRRHLLALEARSRELEEKAHDE